jgi:hypothetical protein
VSAEELEAAERAREALRRKQERRPGEWSAVDVDVNSSSSNTDTDDSAGWFSRLEAAWRVLDVPQLSRVKLRVKYVHARTPSQRSLSKIPFTRREALDKPPPLPSWMKHTAIFLKVLGQPPTYVCCKQPCLKPTLFAPLAK